MRKRYGEVGDMLWILEYSWRFATVEMVQLVPNGIKYANEDWCHHLNIIYMVSMKKFTES